MAVNERGGFRPPDANKLVTKCPACQAFNSPKDTKCKKCGAELKKDADDKK
ncbi:MAG: hypothetical protein H6Q64_2455 [Firmicutes bacterium]|nr:hypothetical protein [Bacillota bacterium]